MKLGRELNEITFGLSLRGRFTIQLTFHESYRRV